ncbi:MAG: hypothetical protein LBS62_06035 [Clostridiales bacterium]|nr:hypothetical protein [Clostridiales bacterium]
MSLFPRTNVAGLSLSRMIIGTNWMAGWSHTSRAADNFIKRIHSTPDSVARLLEAYQEYGVDTIMGPFGETPEIFTALQRTGEKLGKGFILIDTPIINVDDNAAARREAEARIKRSKELGAAFCLIHHSSIEQLVNKNLHRINRIEDYTSMIRGSGLIPGLSAHMPEIITFCDENDYDVQTYIQIFNCMGFLMQVEVETVAAIIQTAKKPVMAIKSMAAGRVTPYVGLTFAWSALRGCDMVTVGAFTEDEVHEDVEISLAALESRFPNIEKRESPNQNQAAFGSDKH